MTSPATQWDALLQDLRYTLRSFKRAPGFALTAILVIALGVGANTAAFSVADFVLLRPVPFPVVSASFGDRYWPGQDAIGKSFRHGGQTRAFVGIVADIRVRGLERTSEPQMYLPALQAADQLPANFDPKDLVIRHSGREEALIDAVRQIVRAADPDQPISNIRQMDEVLAGETASRRAQLQVLAVLAAVAVLLSCVGIYGLLAYTMAQRSLEIGVRLALGAEPARVGRMILADGMRLALLGIGPGVAAAHAAGLAFLMTFAGSLVPAIRAVRVTPMSVLRAA